MSPVNPSAAVKDAERRAQQLLLLNRHDLPKPHFMEVITESTVIPVLSPKLVREENLNRIRRQNTLKGLNPNSSAILDSLSGSLTDPSSVSPIAPSKRSQEAEQAAKSKSLQSQMLIADKK